MLGLILSLGTANYAHAQTLSNLSPNTVVGRLGAGVAGPAQAISFSVFGQNIGAFLTQVNGINFPSSYTTNTPLIYNGTTIANGTVSGNTTIFATAKGTLTSGDGVKIDANGNFVDSGSAFISTVSNSDGSLTISPTTGAVVASLASVGANTMLGNWTASSHGSIANTMPSCADSGGNHLNYVNGTGVTCGTSGGTITQLTPKTDGTTITANCTSGACNEIGYTSGSITPTDGSVAGLTFTGVTALYKQINNLIVAYVQVTYPSTADTHAAQINGLPGSTSTIVTVSDMGCVQNYTNSGSAFYIVWAASGDVNFFTTAGAAVNNNTLSGKVIAFTCIYPAS